MPRRLRLDIADATYHITSRGVHQGRIFTDDRDHRSMLDILAESLSIHQAKVLAYCLMGNHYHLVLHTKLANVSSLMRRINTRYALAFNRRHGRCGHVFEGRFKGIHVDRDAYLLAVCRYVELNPVRARLVNSAGQWEWSSYRAHTGAAPVHAWLASTELHEASTGLSSPDSAQLRMAQRRYVEWVDAGLDVRLWQESLREGRYLGDSAFIQRVNSRRP